MRLRRTELAELEVAGIVSRGVAALIDLVVTGVVIGILYLGLALTRLVLQPRVFQFPQPNVFFSTTVTFGVAVCYLAACWAPGWCTSDRNRGLIIACRTTSPG
ncbi:MAG: hypothetical protein M3O32_10750 [Actinomycetota bacterium]|nr:hypothetical protein [Actinomycetota bacterium]